VFRHLWYARYLRSLIYSLNIEREDVYHYEEGIKEFVSYVNEGKEVLHDVTMFTGASNGIEVVMINIFTFFAIT
jgi:DNA gyrase/topoisomerase IV subunit B